MTEHEALLCLNAVSGLGSIRIRQLLEVFGKAGVVFRQAENCLCRVPGIGAQTARHIRHFDCDAFLQNEISLMQQHQVKLIAFFDEDYPEYLKQVFDFPVVLYVAGDWKRLSFPGLAVVGSRRASVYGTSVAASFAARLAAAGITVVSGMARGIDAAAHQGCCRAAGRTVAVLGSGLSRIYPPEHKGLYQEICRAGAVVSEFPMETGPQAGNFPRRNRIISGLSAGVIVVEAADRSGALITAQCALDQGREVFAVPGKIGQAQAGGTNRLIQSGAKLVVSVGDVLEEFPGWEPGGDQLRMPTDQECRLTSQEQRILDLLSDEPVYVDVIMDRTGWGYQRVISILLKLECTGRIKRLPGNYFIISKLGI